MTIIPFSKSMWMEMDTLSNTLVNEQLFANEVLTCYNSVHFSYCCVNIMPI